MLAERQQRIMFDNEHHHADMVFRSRILKAHATIELKTRKLVSPPCTSTIPKQKSLIRMKTIQSASTSAPISHQLGSSMFLAVLKAGSSLPNTFFIFPIRKHWKKRSRHSSMTGKEKEQDKMADCGSIRRKC